MNTKKLIVAGALLPLLTLTQVTPALAKTNHGATQHQTKTTHKKHHKKSSSNKQGLTHLSGTVESLSGSSFMLTTSKYGSVNIELTADAKFVGKDGKALDPSKIQVGDKVNVAGAFDKQDKVLSEVVSVKDRSEA